MTCLGPWALMIFVSVEYRRGYVSEAYHSNAIGTYIFDGTQGPWKNDATITDNNIKILADYLAGLMASGTVTRGDQAREVFVNSIGVFAQDTWKLRPNVTLNYGVRYDYTGPLYNDNKDLSIYSEYRNKCFKVPESVRSILPRYTNFARVWDLPISPIG